MRPTAPAVSVVTPFYNTAEYLADCIESVLGQSFGDYEYVLADNASTDGSREIAEEYAGKDERIKFLAFDEHLPQIPNYNRALRNSDGRARYCKVVQADDLLMPNGLAEMVRLADSDDRVVMVGAYTVLQDEVFLDGLDFSETVLDGRELCRRYLFDGPYIVGSPTTCLYRMDFVKKRPSFYPEASRLADADVAFEILADGRFGFVHQVLSFVRKSRTSISGQLSDFHFAALTRRVLVEKYGDLYLTPQELRRIKRIVRRRHYQALGAGLLQRRPPEFWSFHREGLADAGLEMSRALTVVGALITLGRWAINLEALLRGVAPQFE